ncbi:ankyrin repeat-containing domain protein, partial [Baffinella frigidus]
AAEMGNPEMVRVMIAGGADVTVQDKCGRTPLQFSAGNGVEWARLVVRMLLDAGVDVAAETMDGRTPMHFVA